MVTHDIYARLSTRNNELIFAGRPPGEIARIAGQTPCYVYDRQKISNAIDRLTSALPRGVHLNYAVKANPLQSVIDLVAAKVDGLDVASHNELVKALSSGMAPSRIYFTGPAKSVRELEAAVAAGVTVNAESERELERLETIAARTGRRPRVCVRVNPDFSPRGAGMHMSGGPKPFGIDADQVPGILLGINRDRIRLKGLHFFFGSQILNPQTLIDSHNQIFSLAAAICRKADLEPEYINIGGGFGVPYFPGDTPLDPGPIARNLKRLMDCRSHALARADIHLELGRYLVAEAGMYLCRVVDKKASQGKTFLMVNGGLHHHLANSGNFGQVVRKNFPVVLANRMTGPSLDVVEIAGPLCTPLDVVADHVALAGPGIGDYIAILLSGAYGASASPQKFLGHPGPAEILL